MPDDLSRELSGLDWSRFLQKEEKSPLDDIERRAIGRSAHFDPITVEERFKGFKLIGFKPHGLFVPNNEDDRQTLREEVKRLGLIDVREDRDRAYYDLQDRTAFWQKTGVPGAWTGQQAVARSDSRFRIVAWGRRGGKSFYAAHEALAVAMVRPRANVWICAPIAKLVERAWRILVDAAEDRDIPIEKKRDTNQERLLVLENGATIEGISMENYLSMAGAAINFEVLDEAAQITPDAWTRGALPPLADRNGQALLISSFEGEGDFFSDKVLEVEREIARAESRGLEYKGEWERFQGASYDENFFAFPQGRETPTLQAFSNEMEPTDFLEQFGAHVAAPRDRVLPEFKEKVHVGNYPFNPDLPVILACDPSSGSNPYAIVAIQDYSKLDEARDYIIIIDEFYEKQMKVEDIYPVISQKIWFPNVTEMVCDSAWPQDIERWCNYGLRAFPVFQKPKIEQRLGMYRNMLRDGNLFQELWQGKMDAVLVAMGFAAGSYFDLPNGDQKRVMLAVQESFAENELTPEDVELLKQCSHVFVDRRCVNTIMEHKGYVYTRRRNLAVNFRETPKDHNNHIIDSAGYYVWTYKRWYVTDTPKERTYIRKKLPEQAESDVLVLESRPNPPMGELWLRHHRQTFMPRGSAGRSYLRGRM